MSGIFHTLCIGLAFGATAASATEIKWPDAAIPIPPAVEAFIVAECRNFGDVNKESLGDCVSGERFGYRAVAMLLIDKDLGELAAERYRACEVALRELHGRYHRTRAECIGETFGITWIFEASRKA